MILSLSHTDPIIWSDIQFHAAGVWLWINLAWMINFADWQNYSIMLFRSGQIVVASFHLINFIDFMNFYFKNELDRHAIDKLVASWFLNYKLLVSVWSKQNKISTVLATLYSFELECTYPWHLFHRGRSHMSKCNRPNTPRSEIEKKLVETLKLPTLWVNTVLSTWSLWWNQIKKERMKTSIIETWYKTHSKLLLNDYLA